MVQGEETVGLDNIILLPDTPPLELNGGPFCVIIASCTATFIVAKLSQGIWPSGMGLVDHNIFIPDDYYFYQLLFCGEFNRMTLCLFINFAFVRWANGPQIERRCTWKSEVC